MTLVEAGKVRIAVNVLVIALVANFAAAVVVSYIESRLAVPPAPPEAATADGRARSGGFKPYDAYQNIVGRNLFGPAAIVRKEAPPPPPPPAEIPVTTQDLGLDLVGVINGAGTGSSAAIIRDRRQNNLERVYRPGDSVRNIQIVDVQQNGVRIRVDGKDMLLVMSLMDQVKKLLERPDQGPRDPMEILQQIQGGDLQGQSGQRQPQPQPQVTAQIGRDDIQKAVSDMASLIRGARFSKVNTGGVSGLRLDGIKPGSLYKRLDLKNGDVLLSINGKPVTSMEQATSLYRSLGQAPGIELDVMRDGKRETLSYSIK